MSRSSGTRQGVLLVVGAMACFAVLDTMAKYVSTTVPLVVAMWSRYMFQACFTGGVLLPHRGRGLFKTRHPWLQLVRGLLLVLSSSLAFISLRTLPVGEFTAILMLAPMLITVVSASSLGERVSVLRWLLLSGGLAGALIVIRPGADDFQWAMVFPLALVVANAAFQLLTSYLAQKDDPGTMHFYTGVVATVLATLALPFAWETPGSAGLWVLLALLGVFSTLGHYLLILGYGRASPATLTPYLYFQIAFATLAGWLVFSHAPDRWSVMGIVVIAVCGVTSTWLSGQKNGRLSESEPTL
ncbi:DMT family transporter [Polaromonas sp.]|uniref:DMT family transporter n=1 Tax=Polaromonas sp. TaxID=1869339 RepID=UPI002FC88C94